jgi:hypothetical protein
MTDYRTLKAMRSNTVVAAVTAREPKHPRRFEKNKNIADGATGMALPQPVVRESPSWASTERAG